MQLVAYLA
jgi:hypothetical protein